MSFVICAENDLSVHELVLRVDRDGENAMSVDQAFANPVLLDQLTYDTDVFMQQAEFFYLVDFKSGSWIAADEIKQAITYLFRKKKFQEIRLRIEATTEGTSLHFTLIGCWTFEKLKMQGVLVGKDMYSQYYLMEPGDRFEQVKHEHSIEKIRDALKKEGYLHTQITSHLAYDSTTKGITVHLGVSRGKRFVINDLQLWLKTDDDIANQELRVLNDQLQKKYLKKLVKKPYSKSVCIEQAQEIKRYLAEKGYLHVFITLDESINYKQESISLRWTVDLHHKRLFIFFGNRFFSNNQLLDCIVQFGRSASLLPASMLAQEIERAYHCKGFWDIQIETREENERYFFLIKEGARAVIANVVLHNVHNFSPKWLIKRCFTQLRKRACFDQNLLQQSLDSLIVLYFKKGFLDARIVSHDFVSTGKLHTYTLAVTLDEGTRTNLMQVTIPVLPELEWQGPFEAVQKKIDQAGSVPFDTVLVQEQRKWLLDHLHKQGYLQATVKPEIAKDEKSNVSLIWRIDCGEKVYFGKTILRSSTHFPFEYILRELQYKEGDLWDQEKIKQSFLRVKACDIFESIQLSPVHDLLPTAKKPVLLTVRKDDPFELRVRSGLEFQNVRRYHTIAGLGYRIGSTFIVKNPFDAADLARLDIDLARSHREIIARYQRPWLFDLPVSSLFQAYSIKHEQPGFIGSKKNIYTVNQHGLLLGLTKKTIHFDGALNLGMELMQITITDVANKQRANQLASAINFEPELLGVTVPYIFIEPTVLVDYVDSRPKPRSGSLSIFSLKGMFPLSKLRQNSYFVRLLIEQSFFIPLRAFVAAIRLRFGHIFHKKFCAIMPTERFYLGGAQSLRSYETDLAPPLGCFTNAKGKQYTVPRGGKSMLSGNAELRFPLFFPDLGGVVFQDFGMLSGDEFAEFNAENILAATGCGLRYYTPIGPIRFDIGWKWRLTSPSERRFAWFLTVGHAF